MMKLALFSLLVAVMTVDAKPLWMAVCYTTIPDGADASTICGAKDRVLLTQSPEHHRQLMSPAEILEATIKAAQPKCGTYCAGWDKSNFCMEYLCADPKTDGMDCEGTPLIPATDTTKEIAARDGVRDLALAHYKEFAEKTKSDECIKMMENLSCMCIDQSIEIDDLAAAPTP